MDNTHLANFTDARLMERIEARHAMLQDFLASGAASAAKMIARRLWAYGQELERRGLVEAEVKQICARNDATR